MLVTQESINPTIFQAFLFRVANKCKIRSAFKVTLKILLNPKTMKYLYKNIYNQSAICAFNSLYFIFKVKCDVYSDILDTVSFEMSKCKGFKNYSVGFFREC